MRRRQRFLINFRKACRHRNVLMQAVDLLIHKHKINTHWENYYRFGFYRHDITWPEKALYVGDQGSYYWPWENNSLKFDHLFIRKSLQKSVLLAAGVSTPRLLLKAGSCYEINSAEQLAEALRGVDRPFLTKFDGGGSGAMNLAFEPDGAGFRCGDATVDAEWIWGQYRSVADPGFLVEERLRNHDDLAAIHPPSLNTLRLNLVKTADGEWRQLRPLIKFGRGGSHIDNSSAGGLFAAIEEGGKIGIAYDNDHEAFTHHPDTGVAIRGQVVPHYEEALDIALRASRLFGFMGTIGWDVGITPAGPTIIEGNPSWESRNYQDVFGPFLTPEIAAGLVSRNWWTPWDRTHMYPGYMKDASGGPWQRYLARRRERSQALALQRSKEAAGQ